MTIKNKDGSIYTLNGPNPLMKDQDNFKEFILHNCLWEKEVQKKIEKIAPVKSDFNIKKLEKEIIEVVEKEKIEVVEKIEDTKRDPINSNITRIHCLPIKIEKKTDNLYGESRIVSSYDKPFIFEAVIIDQHDFIIKFWTNIDILEQNSIIYPINKDKRWWKIHNKIDHEQGWLYNALPSDTQPDFT